MECSFLKFTGTLVFNMVSFSHFLLSDSLSNTLDVEVYNYIIVVLGVGIAFGTDTVINLLVF